MIKAEWFYWLCGLIFVVISGFVFVDRSNSKRITSGTFWALLGVSFVLGTFVTNGSMPPWILGAVVIVLAILAGTGRLGRGAATGPGEAEQKKGADRFGGWLFVPALIIPVVTVIFATAVKAIHVNGKPLLETGSETIIGLGVASIIAVVAGVLMLRPPSPAAPVHEARRLLEAIGWAVVLPQMLATLGNLFTAAGVGKAVGTITQHVIPSGSLIGAVVVYCVGMALFTVIMGNAFAAFPIMTAAIGWPVLVQQFHGNPAAVFAIGMLAGFCGTLCTPMAANFNIVPAALLEMNDRYGAIKAQLPTAVPLLVANIALMYFLAF
ncbi:MAG TPA: DUF979 domain-containing protein [Pseudonocardiaceae bacterium]|jgi:uncharacterized membrane protein